MTAAALARHAEQQASDAAYTRCVAAEIALRRLRAEQTVDIAQEQQGELSYGETRVAQSRTARLDAQLDAMTPEQLTALRVRMVRCQGTAEDYALHARLINRTPLAAQVHGAGFGGHFDSAADLAAERSWSR
jgi:hypothetical protein